MSTPDSSRSNRSDKSHRSHTDSSHSHADSSHSHADSSRSHADSSRSHADSSRSHADSSRSHHSHSSEKNLGSSRASEKNPGSSRVSEKSPGSSRASEKSPGSSRASEKSPGSSRSHSSEKHKSSTHRSQSTEKNPQSSKSSSKSSTKASLSVNERKPGDVSLEEFDFRSADHTANLKDQLKRLRNQQIQILKLIHDSMKKNEVDNDSRMDRHTETYRKAVIALQKSGDDNEIKKKLDELKSMQESENSAAQEKQKTEFNEFDVLLQRKLKDIEDISNALVKNDPSYKGDLLPSKVDRRNSSHVKYVREQLTKLREEELASQQQLFNLRAKQQNAMDKLTVEQNEKFSRIFGALLRAKLSDEVQQTKTDQMKQMLSKDRETLQKKQRGEFFAAESDMVGIVKKIIEFEQSISSDNPESPNALVPIRRVPSSLLQGPGSGGSSTTRDEGGSTSRSVNLDRGEKNTDITLAEFNPKNPDHVVNLKQQLKKLRVHELQLHQRIHETMRKNEEDNDQMFAGHDEQFNRLVDDLQSPSVAEDQIKLKFDGLNNRVDQENQAQWTKQKNEFSDLDQQMQKKLKEMADIEAVLFRSDPTIRDNLQAADVKKDVPGHVKYARHQLGRLKKEEVAIQQQMSELRVKQQADYVGFCDQSNDKIAQMLAQLKRGNKTEEQVTQRIDQLRKQQNKGKNDLFKKQKEEFLTLEAKAKQLFEKIVEYERAISSNNMRSLTALFPIRRIPSEIIRKNNAVASDDYVAEDADDDDADTQLRKLTIRRLRQEELKLEDKIYDMFRKQEKYNSHVEKDQSSEFMKLISELLINKESEDEIKKQTEKLRKMVEDDNAVISNKQAAEFRQLQVDVKKRVHDIEKLEDEISEGVNPVDGKVKLENFDRGSRSHVYNLQKQIRLLRGEEFILQSKLNDIRARQWEANRKMFVEHYDRFGKIQRGLTKAKLSDEMVNTKSEQVRDMLEKDKDSTFEKQKEEFYRTETELLGVLQDIVNIERVIQTSKNVNTKFSYDPLRKVPNSVEIVRPSAIQFESYISQKELVSREVPAPKIDFDQVGDEYRRVRQLRQEELAIEYRIHIALVAHEKYNGYISRQQNRKFLRIEADLLKKGRTSDEIKKKLELIRKEYESDNETARENQKEEIEQLKSELKTKIKEIAEVEREFAKAGPVLASSITVAKFDKKNPAHVYNLQEQLQELRDDFLDQEVKLFELRVTQQKTNQKMSGDHNEKFAATHVQVTNARAQEKEIIERCDKLRDTLEKEKDTEYAKQQKDFSGVEDPLLKKARQMQEIEKALQTASDEFWYAYFPSRKIPGNIDLIRPGAIAYDPEGKGRFEEDDGEDEELREYDQQYRRPPPDTPEVQLKKLRLKGMRTEELELINKMHMALKNQEKYNAAIGKRHSEEFLKMLTSEMNRPDQTEAEMRAKNEEWKKVFDDENKVIADNQNREYNELVDSFRAKVKQIGDLENELAKGVAPMEKTLPLNRFDVNSKGHVYNLQQQLQKYRQEVLVLEKNLHEVRMGQVGKNQTMANNHNEKFALLQQGLVETGLNEEEVKERSEQMRNVLEKDKDKLHDKQRDEFGKIEEKLREKLKQMMEIEKTIQTSNTNTRFTYEPVRRIVSRIWLIRPAESSYDPYGLRQNQDEVLAEADFNELDKIYGRKFLPGTRKKEKEAERAALAEQAKKMSELHQRFWEVRGEDLSLDDKLVKVFRSQEKYNAHLLREQNKEFIVQEAGILSTEKNEEAYGKKLEAINWTFDVENKLVKRNMEDEINGLLAEKQKKLKELTLVENELYKGAPALAGDIVLSKFDKKNPSHVANLQRQLQDLRIETIEYWKALYDVRLRQQEQSQKVDQETNVKFGTLQMGLKKGTMNEDVLKGKSEVLRDKLDALKEDVFKTQTTEFRDLENQIRQKYKTMGDIENALKGVDKNMNIMYSPAHKNPSELPLFRIPRIGYDPFEKFREFEEDQFDEEDDDDAEEEGSVIRRKSAKVRFEALEHVYKKSLPPLPDTADQQLLKIQLKKQRTDELELLERMHTAMRNQEKYNSIIALNQCAEFMRAQSDMLMEEETEEVILKTNAEIKQQFTDHNAAVRENERREIDELEQSLRRKLREIANIENALNKNVPIFDEPINMETYNKQNPAHVYNLQLQVQGMREEIVTMNQKLHNVRMGHVVKNQARYGEDVEQFAMLQNGLSKAGLTNETIKEKSDEMKAALEKDQNRIYQKQKDEFENIETRMQKKIRLLAQYEAAIGDSQTNTKFAYEPPRRVPSRIVLAPPVGIQYDVLYNKVLDDDDEDAIKDFDELNKIYGLKNKIKLPKSQKRIKEEEAAAAATARGGGKTTTRGNTTTRSNATTRDFKAPEEPVEEEFTHLGDEGDDTFNFKIRKNVVVKEVPEDSKEVQMLKAQLRNIRQQEKDIEDEVFEVLKKQEEYNAHVEIEQSEAFLQLKNELMQTVDDEEEIKKQLVELLQTFNEDNQNIKAGQQQEFDETMQRIAVKVKEMQETEDKISEGIVPLHGPPKDDIYDLNNPGHIVYLTKQMQQMRSELLELFKAISNSRFQHIDSNQKLFADFNLKFYMVHNALMGSRLSDEVLKTKLAEMKNELEIDKGKMHEYFVEEFSLAEIRLHKRMKDISNLEAAISESNKYSKFAYETAHQAPGKIALSRPTEILYDAFNRPAVFDEVHEKDFQELEKMYGQK